MADQGTGGPVESGQMHASHARNKSAESMSDAIPAQTGNADSRATPVESDNEPQQLPRGVAAAGERSSSATPVPVVAPNLARNPSSCSTMSSRPQTNYFSATPVLERRPSPIQHPSARPQEPPVTKATLSELDVNKIIHNPKLRHDINFDPELHFRPNLDGEKGRRKQEKANQFWTSLNDQLVQFVVDREAFYRVYGTGDDWCLPLLLKAVKEIIQTLVPHRDRQFLDEGLNVDLLMQEFDRGVADLEKLASWLSSILKLHCAPMRDEWVDEMYNELSNGNRNNDVPELVKGMRNLLGVLEAMKLDVANHQIRCLRPILIEDTAMFEQKFFVKKIEQGKLNIAPARDWYRAAEDDARHQLQASFHPPLHAQAFGEMAVFFEASARLILPSTDPKQVPPTFLFDDERLLKLRADMADAIFLEVCMRVYEQWEQTTRVVRMAYVLDEDASSAEHYAGSNGSRPSSFVGSDCGSSDRNSGLFYAQPTSDSAEQRAKTRTVYSSLLALLHTSPASASIQKWKSLAPSIALQIFRFLEVEQKMLPMLEDALISHICNEDSQLFRDVEAHFHRRLLEDLARRVKEWKNLGGVGLFSQATGARLSGPGRTWDGSLRERDPRERELFETGRPTSTREPRDDAGVDDMASRLAHLGILHWRVWSRLAYCEDAGASEDATQLDESMP